MSKKPTGGPTIERKSFAVAEVRGGRAEANRIERDVSASVDMTKDLTCPVCGTVAVQEKCKVICRSETCRGRVILNCSEF
jgi:hypothetical protein